MLLIVEDSRATARTLKHQCEQHIPEAQISCVADGENAFKALTGQEYEEWNLAANTTGSRSPSKFTAVIWDNTFPKKGGGRAEEDVGLDTVKALATSDKVDKEVLGRFVSHSSDSPDRFRESGLFCKVYEKPMRLTQIKELGELFAGWKGSSTGSATS